MTRELHGTLSAAILAADPGRLWSWAVEHGLAEGAGRDDFADDEMRDMLLKYLDALNAEEADAMRRAV